MIKTAKIIRADISMEDHGCLVIELTLEGDGWGVVFGGYSLGHGYLGCKDFVGYKECSEALMRIMDTVGVERFSELKGKTIRVVEEGFSNPIRKIGNATADKWFSYDDLFKVK